MRLSTATAAIAAAALAGVVIARSALQTPAVLQVDEKVLPDRDRFFAGPGAAVATSIESRVEFQRDADGKIASLTWQREGAPVRLARRVDIERHEDVRLSSGDIQLAGTLITPSARKKHPAIILVHASGPVDQAQNEMMANGMRPPVIEQVIGLMKLQYRFVQTGEGWDEYAATRAKIAARMGAPPAAFPGREDHPSWQFMRRIYFYDPAPTLRRLQTPTLAIFGALDNNIMAEKNKVAWETALKAGGHRDYTLRILPKANHLLLEAQIGSNAEIASLRRFVPEYATTVHDWLAKRVRGYGRSK